MYYVYVLHSASYGLYYKGFTQDVERRLSEHNRDKSRYTSGKGPWDLLILEVFETKREALIREKSLKRCKPEYYEWLRFQPRNRVQFFRSSV